MKAMILAAGFGSRLKDITVDIPKPLVDVGDSKKIIDIVVDNLLDARIDEIAVNLHYKGDIVKNYLREKYPEIKWRFYFEKEILGTGGGLYNAKDFFIDCNEFVLINSDIMIFSDIKKFIRKHRENKTVSSLVLFENQNDKRGVYYIKNRVSGFSQDKIDNYENIKTGTFTGIHIINNKIFDYINNYLKKNREKKFSIINIYKHMIKTGKKVGAIETKDYWRDLGTIESLKEGRKEYIAFNTVKKEFGEKVKTIKKTFQGGSNKRIFRVETEKNSKIIIFSKPEEIKSISAISIFFQNKKYPIPKIIKNSKEWIIMEEGGKLSLLDIVNKYKKENRFPIEYYKKAIDCLDELARIDIKKFPVKSLYQTAYFDLENIKFDINYFNRYYFKKLSEEEIDTLADKIYKDLKKCPVSIIHRDYQSTNILINGDNELRIIDFQTMRLGPIVYDLASLIFDSYIPFDKKTINTLIDYFFSLENFKNLDKKVFWTAAFIRILQNLGAFGKLGENNRFFHSKIEEAEKRLKYILQKTDIKVDFD